MTFGYTSTAIQSGIYNVTVTTVSNSTSTGFVFVVDSNNDSVISATVSGYTMTGPNAKTTFDGMMTLFGLETVYSNELNVYTNSAYFKNEGTSTMTFGTVSFPVTTYGLNSPNETFSECGITDTITAYTLQVGTRREPLSSSLPT